MTIRLTHLSILAALAAVPAFAQDTGTESGAPAETEEAASPEAPDTGDAPDAAGAAGAGDAPQEGETAAGADAEAEDGQSGGLTTGESVPSNPSEDRSFVKAEEGDWQVECVRNQDGSEGPCQLYQLLEGNDGSPVAEARIFRVEDGGQVVAGANMIVPLETLLTEKLTMSVDGGQAKRYDYTFCTQIGCIARFGFTQGEIDRLKAGAAAQVSLVPAVAPDQRVTTEMSLSGFTAGFDMLEPITLQ